MVQSMTIELRTQGDAQMIDITRKVADCVQRSALTSGVVTIFTPSSTSGLTTIEYEPGAVHDFQRLFDEIAEPDRVYEHHLRWGDHNGHSHVRAALLGPSLTVPFIEKQLTLGTWQQIIFVDFDNRPRQRSLVLQLIGE